MVSSGSEKKSGNGLQTMPTVKKGKKKQKKKHQEVLSYKEQRLSSNIDRDPSVGG